MTHPTTPREQFHEAVMRFRKTAYEFGMADNPEDHETMLAWQRRIFELYDQAAKNAPAPDHWPARPLKQVQVTMPNGDSALLTPERAYFSAWAVQEIENRLSEGFRNATRQE